MYLHKWSHSHATHTCNNRLHLWLPWILVLTIMLFTSPTALDMCMHPHQSTAGAANLQYITVALHNSYTVVAMVLLMGMLFTSLTVHRDMHPHQNIKRDKAHGWIRPHAVGDTRWPRPRFGQHTRICCQQRRHSYSNGIPKQNLLTLGWSVRGTNSCLYETFWPMKCESGWSKLWLLGTTAFNKIRDCVQSSTEGQRNAVEWVTVIGNTHSRDKC